MSKLTFRATPGPDPHHPTVILTMGEQTFVLAPRDVVEIIEKIQAALGQVTVAWDAIQPWGIVEEDEGDHGHYHHSVGGGPG